MKPVVTIGVCVKDSASTLQETLESIMRQDYPHELMEVIFVDDGSVDETLSVINDYASRMDMRAKVFHHEWKGLGVSRNVVVNNTCGDYIVWVDGDIVLPSDHIRQQVEFMEKAPEVGIAKAKYGIQPGENVVGFLENVCYVAVDSLHGGKYTSRILGAGGSIYRVKAICEVGGFDTCISGVGEDMDIETRVRRANWFLYLGTPAIFYEQRRKSLISIWREGFWHGYGGHSIFQKDKGMFALYKMTPLAGLVAGAWYANVAYKITHRKLVFLLPLQYAFKRVAWCFGFIKGQIV